MDIQSALLVRARPVTAGNPIDNRIPWPTGAGGSPTVYTSSFYAAISRVGAKKWHLPGVFSRLGLLERITLTPEGRSIQELKRLTQLLLHRGQRVFTFNYHSSALLPGYTPYVRSQADLDRMVGTIDEYLHYFIEEIGGITMTPTEFRSAVMSAASVAIDCPAWRGAKYLTPDDRSDNRVFAGRSSAEIRQNTKPPDVHMPITVHAIDALSSLQIARWNEILLTSPFKSAFLSHAFCKTVDAVRGGVFVLHFREQDGAKGFFPFRSGAADRC